MKAIVSERYGVDRLELREVETPVPEDHQVLVRVHASSVNPADWYRVMGPPFVRVMGGGLRGPKDAKIGSDFAGRIEAVGKDVTELQPGDDVFGTTLGAWAEYAPAREPRVARKPPSISYEEAAAVPIAGLTALQALRDKGNVQPGQRVLVNGASGGVGTYAIQLAKSFGAEVTAVCSTQNVEQARELGADRVIDYAREDFTRTGERHDLLVDIAGSRPLSALRRALTPDATVVVIGARMKASLLGPLPHIVGTRVGSIGRKPKVIFFVAKIEQADLAFMADQLASGKVRSVIDRRFALGETADALRYLGEGHARGKIVLSV